jgi:hypothetical protein
VKRDPAHGKEEYGPFQHALKQIGFERVLKMGRIDDESSGVRLPTFDGTDANWHAWKRSLSTMPDTNILKES